MYIGMKLKSLFKKSSAKSTGSTSPSENPSPSPSRIASRLPVPSHFLSPLRGQLASPISLDSFGIPQESPEVNNYRECRPEESISISKSRSDPAPFQSRHKDEEEDRNTSIDSLDVIIQGESRKRIPLHPMRIAMSQVFLTPEVEVGSVSETAVQSSNSGKCQSQQLTPYYTPESYDATDNHHVTELKVPYRETEDTYDGRPSPQPSKIRVPHPDESVVVSAMPAKCISSTDSDTRSTPDSRSGLSDRESWDRRSERSMESQLSVACLQGRIQQMEENHHSQSEELQATLHELSDLQHTVSELHSENEHLIMQRNEFLMSIDRLQHDVEELNRKANSLERLVEETEKAKNQEEDRYLQLLRAGEDERAALLRDRDHMEEIISEREEKIMKLQKDMDILQVSLAKFQEACTQKCTDEDVCRCGASSEIIPLKAELESAKKQLHTTLDNLDAVREHLAATEEEAKDERSKLHDRIIAVEHCLEESENAKSSLSAQVNDLHSALSEAEDSCRRHAEEKRELRNQIAECRAQIAEAQAGREEAERLLAQEREAWDEQTSEWRQFQRDLLTTVRVANDFKVDAQLDLERTVHENQGLRDRLLSLQAELDKARAQIRRPQSPPRIVRTPSMNDGTSRSLAPPDIVNHRPRPQLTRLDSRLSVKRLVETIEQTACRKPGDETSPSSPVPPIQVAMVRSPSSPCGSKPPLGVTLREGRREPQPRPMSAAVLSSTQLLGRPGQRSSYSDAIIGKTVSSNSTQIKSDDQQPIGPLRLLANSETPIRSLSFSDVDRKENPLAGLVKTGGSKRNALLKWCQSRTAGYSGIDITNFSSSWADGLALSALLHTFLPDKIPFDTLKACDPRTNFEAVFKVAEEEGIPTMLSFDDMLSEERPDWQKVLSYVTAIYQHFECRNNNTEQANDATS
ncbi:cytospin-A-like [Artemia franciscana]|uniref:cytospin-A-like n=1 Tax=Artemia franciscana TaxID=6661 RepID=UPI0032DA586F